LTKILECAKIEKEEASMAINERGEFVRESEAPGRPEQIGVRMKLFDYDAAPDGAGTYKKLDEVFPSKEAALSFRARHLHNMYWGRIETLDGKLIEHIEEEYDNPRMDD
jgi:hypothetical protein